MSTAQREQARRDALRVAAVLRTNTPDDPTIRAAAQLLEDWRTDEPVRDALRPVFAAAVPDQRALIALGDIDAWLRDGRVARAWWETAAAGPDEALAAEAAWKVGCAHRRAGRRDVAAPFLRQAAAGGWTDEAETRRRVARERAAEDAARREEDRLRSAQRCLDADDAEGAEALLQDVERPDSRLGGPCLPEWEQGLHGELAFRRGDLDEAIEHFDAAGTDRHGRLRRAQLAVLQDDAPRAYVYTMGLADDEDEIGDAARLLIRLHVDLIAAGMPIDDEGWVCMSGCCCDAECEASCGWVDDED
ncbi:hypothetical protein [Actinomycetospora termitidis]|uniref:Tetratricopeptide repeat protein n=1 Tax=Actinomycetospora termitidis TaxID=3053470 RepID=A0ABT7M1B8_9PSEU|nr:hypothetical protein [Actinomycetospora sp. Odt1-22]MDL5154458.1 hypothetical protein [Actinomycetospora sp. Odt1-22]